jgi:hypothetical protein
MIRFITHVVNLVIRLPRLTTYPAASRQGKRRAYLVCDVFNGMILYELVEVA